MGVYGGAFQEHGDGGIPFSGGDADLPDQHTRLGRGGNRDAQYGSEENKASFHKKSRCFSSARPAHPAGRRPEGVVIAGAKFRLARRLSNAIRE
jgi:hypothetical protein